MSQIPYGRPPMPIPPPQRPNFIRPMQLRPIMPPTGRPTPRPLSVRPSPYGPTTFTPNYPVNPYIAPVYAPKQPDVVTETMKIIFISNLTEGVTDDLIKKLLEICGELISWTRMKDAKNVLSLFGFAKYTSIAHVERAIRVLGLDSLEGIEIPSPLPSALNAHVKLNVNDKVKKYRKNREGTLTNLERSDEIALDAVAKDKVDAMLKPFRVRQAEVFLASLDRNGEVPQSCDETDYEALELTRIQKRKSEMVREYQERERRWENHEMARKRHIERDLGRENERRNKRLVMKRNLEMFDEAHCDEEFYRNRGRWYEHRLAFKKREEEMDEKDRRVEMNEKEHPEKYGERDYGDDLEGRADEPGLEQVGRIMTVEERKEAITKLVERIPTEKEELFSWVIKWDYVDADLIKNKLVNFISKKVVEYLGEEEVSVIEFVTELLVKKTSPYVMIDKLEELLDEDTEMFVKKLWRMLVFEIESRFEGIA